MTNGLDDKRENVAFSGIIGEVIHQKQPDGRIFEIYRRPPGTRLIIVSPDNKILITKEHRAETGNIDLRLPGGKVRDSLEQYEALLNSGQDIAKAAAFAAIKEAEEEAGLIVKNPELLTISTAGATVEWDLYYFLVKNYENSQLGQQLKEDEIIEVSWMTPLEIIEAVKKGQMQEWRSVGVLLGLVLPSMHLSDE